MRARSLLRTVLLLAVVRPGTDAATAQELSWSGSIQYASGSYIFTEPIRTVSLYNSVSLAAGPLRMAASLPLIVQNSGAVTVVGGSYLPTGGNDHEAVGGRQKGSSVPMGGHRGSRPSIVDGTVGGLAFAVEEGSDSVVAEPGPYELAVGDPLLYGGLELHQGSGMVRSLEITASAKIPVNDLDSGVGTGEWDYGAGMAAAVGAGPVLAFVDATWWWYGDLPGLELRDGISWGGGLGMPVSRAVWVSAMATRSNRIIDTAEVASTLTGAVSYRTRASGTLTVTVGTGLTETSPDLTVSLGWRRTLGSGG